MQISTSQYAEIVKALRASEQAGNHERPKFTRMDVQAKVAIAIVQGPKVVQSYAALTRNVSLGGVGLLQGMPIDRGTHFVVRLATEKSTYLMLSIVRHTVTLADNLFGIGSEFVSDVSKDLAGTMGELEQAETERIRKSMLG